MESEKSNKKSQSLFSKRMGAKKKAIPKNYQVQDDTIYEKFTKLMRKPNSMDQDFIKSCLTTHFVFCSLTDDHIDEIVSNMFFCEVVEKEFVFQQGDIATRGKLQLIVNDNPKRELETGEAFGDLALLYNAPRSASVKAIETSYLWAIDRNTFKNAVEEITYKHFDKNLECLENIKIMNNFDNDQKVLIASHMITQSFLKGQKIIHEGDVGSSFYVIQEGTVSVMKDNNEVRKLTKNDTFGEGALFAESGTRAMTIQAFTDVKCLAIGKETLETILGDDLEMIIYKNLERWAIDKSENLSDLTQMQVSKIIDSMEISSGNSEEVLIKSGKLNDNYKIIISFDSDLIEKSTKKVVAKKGVLYTDIFLFKKNKDMKIESDIVLGSKGKYCSISVGNFIKIIGGYLEEVIEKNKNSSGQFGSVYLVKCNTTNEIYALKCVSKGQILEQNLEEYLKQEKEVLDLINFPFIMQFMRTFKDDQYIYFLLEIIKGLELFDAIRQISLKINSYF